MIWVFKASRARQNNEKYWRRAAGSLQIQAEPHTSSGSEVMIEREYVSESIHCYLEKMLHIMPLNPNCHSPPKPYQFGFEPKH